MYYGMLNCEIQTHFEKENKRNSLFENMSLSLKYFVISKEMIS